jgi:hypothetical protein
MSAHIANTIIEKMNGRRKLRFPSDDRGTPEVVRAISVAHSVNHIATEMCGKTFKTFEY